VKNSKNLKSKLKILKIYELFNTYLAKLNQRLMILQHVAKKAQGKEHQVQSKKKKTIEYECKGPILGIPPSMLKTQNRYRLLGDINGFTTNEERAK